MQDDGKHGYDPSPVNPLPPMVIALFVVIFGIEVVLAAAEAGLVGGPAAIGWRLALLQQYAFSPQVFGHMLDTWQWPPEHLMRFFTYPFLHGSFVQMALAVVFVLAMGKMVGDAMGNVAVAVLFFVSSALGALVYGLVPGQSAALYGAFPGAYGLIGGFTFLIWVRERATGGNQARAFSLIAMLMGVQLLFGAIFGLDNTWLADLGGFLVGFATCFLIVPAARRALLQRLRRE